MRLLLVVENFRNQAPTKRMSGRFPRRVRQMSKKNLVETTTDKDTGEEHVKLNATPEEVARAIFSDVKPPDPKIRRTKKESQ